MYTRMPTITGAKRLLERSEWCRCACAKALEQAQGACDYLKPADAGALHSGSAKADDGGSRRGLEAGRTARKPSRALSPGVQEPNPLGSWTERPSKPGG